MYIYIYIYIYYYIYAAFYHCLCNKTNYCILSFNLVYLTMCSFSKRIRYRIDFDVGKLLDFYFK